ncbi:MAG: transposase [Deltaproteobacteria bacterium]|nr:transposase [Deltaproteobacteria bacterium]
MPGLPLEIQTVLFAFAPLFSTPVWQKACVLSIGAILSIGKRTITSALKAMGLKDEKHFTNYHRVLNRAKWSTLNGAKILLGLIVSVVPSPWPLVILVDETVERRKGTKIKAKGCYHDAVRSSQNKVVHCFGLKWISMMAVVPFPWSRRPWALPFLTVLAPSKSYNKAQNRPHKTTVDWTCQMIMQVRRWLPDHPMVLVLPLYFCQRRTLCLNDKSIQEKDEY